MCGQKRGGRTAEASIVKRRQRQRQQTGRDSAGVNAMQNEGNDERAVSDDWTGQGR